MVGGGVSGPPAPFSTGPELPHPHLRASANLPGFSEGRSLTPSRPQAPTLCAISTPPCHDRALGSPSTSLLATWTTSSSSGAIAMRRSREWSHVRRGWSGKDRSIGKS